MVAGRSIRVVVLVVMSKVENRIQALAARREPRPTGSQLASGGISHLSAAMSQGLAYGCVVNQGLIAARHAISFCPSR